MDEVITLRGHHLLCLHGFRGLGYSDEFVANMTVVHNAVMKGQGTQVRLVIEPDDICSACPSLEKPECGNGSRLAVKDSEILRRLDLSAGAVINSEELLDLVRQRLGPETVRELCSDCRWLDLGYCLEGLSSCGSF